ncbi:hypothetical protein J6590_048743 [Homalodisca vitripennis]|nr:hypothetical protein J6590_048743 [Homalodisca vitripennis]
MKSCTTQRLDITCCGLRDMPPGGSRSVKPRPINFHLFIADLLETNIMTTADFVELTPSKTVETRSAKPRPINFHLFITDLLETNMTTTDFVELTPSKTSSSDETSELTSESVLFELRSGKEIPLVLELLIIGNTNVVNKSDENETTKLNDLLASYNKQ